MKLIHPFGTHCVMPSTWLARVTTGAGEQWDPVLPVLVGLSYSATAPTFFRITLNSHHSLFPANTETKRYLTIKYGLIFF